MASSFAVPIDTPDVLWAIINTEACKIVGCFLNIGATVVPYYYTLLFLSYLLRYFLKKVKDS